MRLKDFFFGLGLKPRTREYPFALKSFALERDGTVAFAQWQHPGALRWNTTLTQAAVDEARRYITAGDAAIDIGAHTGDSTLPLALAAGPAGAVFALEPNPFAYKVLLANTALNKRTTNIYPLMFAATPSDGDMEFEYSDSGFCNGGRHDGVSPWKHGHFFKLKVQGRNISQYLASEFTREAARLRFVKIDTEGFDRSVVASMKDLLKRTRPFLRSEIFRHTPEEERIAYYRDLRALGYRVYRFVSDVEYRGDELSDRDLMRTPHYDIFAVPE